VVRPEGAGFGSLDRPLRELIFCDGLAVLKGVGGRKNITAREIIAFSACST
jgi:hypothetical protein